LVLLQRLIPYFLLITIGLSFSSLAIAIPPDIPTNVVASDGTYDDKVQVTWDDVADEDYYEVSNCVIGCTAHVVSADTTSFDYTAGTPGKAENFKVRACKNGNDCSDDSSFDTGFAKNGSAPPLFSIGSASGSPNSVVSLDLEFTAGWVSVAETTVTVTWPVGAGQLSAVFCDVSNQTVTTSVNSSCDYLANGFQMHYSGTFDMTTGLAASLQIGIPSDAPNSTQLTITVVSAKDEIGFSLPPDYISVSAGSITTLATGVSEDERAALVNFYHATNGSGWDFKDSWLSGDPCVDGWYKVICNVNNTTVTGLDLPANLLSGSLVFDAPNLSDLENLTILNVSHNFIGGQVPAELGDLAGLELLAMNGNQLSGPIPSELLALTSLPDNTGLDINYNLLFTSNAALDTFLDSKSVNDWSATQTTTPTGLNATGSDGTANLTWDLIEFSTGPGHYEVRYSTHQGAGPYTSVGTTDDKSENTIQVSGLSNGVTYYFQVRAVSIHDVNNDSDLVSEYSAEASLLMGTTQEVIFNNSFE